MTAILGLDIGGANLKAATPAGDAASVPFALWREPELLAERLATLIARFPRPTALAVTMTGELADCFATKRDGVERILESVESAAGNCAVHVWTTDGLFLSSAESREKPLSVAAANWHAQATWASRLVPQGEAVLIDCGSTTTDLIPLSYGLPCPKGLTDPQRLLSGELVYQGVRRTPLCAVSPLVPFRGRSCPLAAELFATTLDVNLLLETIAPDPADLDTANGSPATIATAHDRLARMLCCDREELTLEEAIAIARFLDSRLQERLREAADAVCERLLNCRIALISGSGEFLARRLAESLNLEVVSLSSRLTPAISESACAYAAAVLLSERE